MALQAIPMLGGARSVVDVRDFDNSALDALVRAQQAEAGDQSPLYVAIQAQDAARVTALIAEGADVNEANEGGSTLLHLAASLPSTGIVTRLLHAGARVNALDLGGETPLCTAARFGRIGALRALLAAHADANLREGEGRAPLHEAATGCLRSTRLLLAAGATPNVRTYNGETPFLVAVSHNKLDIARLLKEHGANVNARWLDDHETALHKATRMDSVEMVHFLLQHRIDVDAVQSDGQTALHLAVFYKRHDIMTALLAAGANVNVPMEDGRTPAFFLTPRHGAAVMQQLLDAGTDVAAVAHDGETLMHVAVRYNNETMVRLLAARKAPLEGMCKGMTPLHLAVWHMDCMGAVDRAGIVRLLLEAGANVHARTLSMSRTALHLAVLRNRMSVARVLVEAGACITAVDADNKSALYLGLDVASIAKSVDDDEC